MAAQESDIREAGAEVVVIGPGATDEAAALAQRVGSGVRICGDPAGKNLDALGCTRVLGPLRRSGTILVDREGVVRFAAQTINPAAALPWPALRQALAALKAGASPA